MEKIKKIIASCVFVLILATFMFVSTQLLKPSTGLFIQTPGFYKLPKNSLDFVSIGSSHAYCTFDPRRIEKYCGKKSYTFATANLSFPGRLCYLREMYKSQNPQVVFMDMTGCDTPKHFFNVHRHENFTYLPISLNRYLYALKSVTPNYWEDMIFPLKIYHSDWVNFNRGKIGVLLKPNEYKGLRGYIPLLEVHPAKLNSNVDNVKVEIDKEKMDMLDQIVQLSSQRHTTLVFFASPSSMWNQKSYLSVLRKRYRAYEDVRFLDMGDWVESANLNIETDFYDSSHLNDFGVEKISPYIAKYLTQIQASAN